MKGRIRRPSPALIVAVVALIAALSGTAIGLPGNKNVDGNDLKKNVVAFKAMKNNSVGVKELKANSVNNSENARFKSSSTVKLSAAASQAAAPATVLISRDALQLVAKCYLDAGAVEAHIFLRTTAAGAALESDGDDSSGDGAEPVGGYVNPGESEDESEISTAAAGAVGDADGDAENFIAIQGGTAIQGYAGSFAKQGALAAGDGPYGAGNRCMFHAFFGGAG
jgi:hypothetical protein